MPTDTAQAEALRNQFAAAALQGMLSNSTHLEAMAREAIAEHGKVEAPGVVRRKLVETSFKLADLAVSEAEKARG